MGSSARLGAAALAIPLIASLGVALASRRIRRDVTSSCTRYRLRDQPRPGWPGR